MSWKKDLFIVGAVGALAIGGYAFVIKPAVDGFGKSINDAFSGIGNFPNQVLTDTISNVTNVTTETIRHITQDFPAQDNMKIQNDLTKAFNPFGTQEEFLANYCKTNPSHILCATQEGSFLDKFCKTNPNHVLCYGKEVGVTAQPTSVLIENIHGTKPIVQKDVTNYFTGGTTAIGTIQGGYSDANLYKTSSIEQKPSVSPAIQPASVDRNTITYGMIKASGASNLTEYMQKQGR